MVKYQLLYFPIRGRMEPVRLLLNDNGIEYEDLVYEGETWKELKPQMQFGQLPCLRKGDFQLVQSNAILRYLGRKHGLYGKNDEEAAFIDMINDSIEDLRLKYGSMIYTNYENGKEPYLDDLPSKFQPFEKLLSKNGADISGCCVGDKKSFADYNLIDLLDIHLVLDPKCLDNFPTLSAYYKYNILSPGIASYRETPSFLKKNINGNGKQ